MLLPISCMTYVVKFCFLSVGAMETLQRINQLDGFDQWGNEVLIDTNRYQLHEFMHGEK